MHLLQQVLRGQICVQQPHPGAHGGGALQVPCVRCLLFQAAEAQVPHEEAHRGGPSALPPLHQTHDELLRAEETRRDPPAGLSGVTSESGVGDAGGTVLPAGPQSTPRSGELGREEQCVPLPAEHRLFRLRHDEWVKFNVGCELSTGNKVL